MTKDEYKSARVTAIILGRMLELSGVEVCFNEISNENFSFEVLTVDSIKNLIKTSKSKLIAFKNATITYEAKNSKEYLIVNSTTTMTKITGRIDFSQKNHLEVKYGDSGIRVSKLYYRDKLKSSIYGERYTIDHVDFNVLDEDDSSIVLDKFTLTSKELIKYLITKYNRLETSSLFYAFSRIEFLDLDYNRMPVLYYNDKFIEEEPFEICEATEEIDKINKWKNKMNLVYGGNAIRCNNSTFDLFKVPNVETLDLPYFLNIAQSAFFNSTLREVRLASPNTTVLQRESLDGDDAIYTNKYGTSVKIIEAYDKSIDKPLFPFELNWLQRTYLSGIYWDNSDDITKYLDNLRFEV